MFTCSRILIFFGAVIACSSCATAFFINWGASDSTTAQQRPVQTYPITYYHQRYLQGSPPMQAQTYVSANSAEQQQHQQPLPMQIPAIPIQVPLQAQLSPINSVHNVQLVPCVCPVSELDYDRSQEGASSVIVNQIKSPHDA